MMNLIRTMPVGQRPAPSGEETGNCGTNPTPLSFLSIDFFDRFRNIQSIRATKRIDDPDQFTFFVKNCKRLMELILFKSRLGQIFFDELPAISSLNILVITRIFYYNRRNNLLELL